MPKPRYYRCVLLLAVIAASTTPLAQDGMLDRAFGQNGFALPGAQSTYGAVSVVASQGDRLVLAGRDGADAVLWRLNDDGTLDSSFGESGRAALIPAGQRAMWNAIHVLADGRILVAGSGADADNAPFAAVARFTADGALDASFGTDGLVLLPDFGPATVVALIEQSPGRTLVVGGRWRATTGNAPVPNNGPWDLIDDPPTTTIVRLAADGALDPTYGTDGVAVLARPDQTVAATDAALHADGSLTVAGAAGVPGSPYNGDWFVTKLTPDGQPDTEFGFQTRDFSGDIEFATAVAVDAQGRVVVAGPLAWQFGNALTFARFLPSGAPDASFGEAGVARFPDPAVGFVVLANDLVVEPSGRIAFVGSRADGFIVSDVLAGRLLDDGSLDASFGGTGIQSWSIAPGDIAYSLSRDGRGRTLVAGAATSNDFTTSVPFALRLLGPTLTSVDAAPSADAVTLDGPAPNPIRSAGRFTYTLDTPGRVELTIMDVLGRRVQTTVDALCPAGAAEVVIDANDLAPGVYFAVLRHDGAVAATRRFTVTR